MAVGAPVPRLLGRMRNSWAVARNIPNPIGRMRHLSKFSIQCRERTIKFFQKSAPNWRKNSMKADRERVERDPTSLFQNTPGLVFVHCPNCAQGYDSSPDDRGVRGRLVCGFLIDEGNEGRKETVLDLTTVTLKCRARRNQIWRSILTLQYHRSC